jgi:hypothetical protein
MTPITAGNSAQPFSVAIVLYQAGTPVPHAWVREVWQDYSVQDEGHEETSTSDEAGFAVFPARSVRASLLRRVLRPLAKSEQAQQDAAAARDARWRAEHVRD